MIAWAGADSPWVHTVGPAGFGRSLDVIRKMAPKAVLSAHLPPAEGRTGQLLELLARVPASAPFVAPDQKALEKILAQGR